MINSTNDLKDERIAHKSVILF